MSKMVHALMMTELAKHELKTLPLPGLAPHHALVEVRAVGVCGSDLHGYTGASGRRKPPLIMGHEAAGQVVAVGEAVTRLKVGARVAMMPLDMTTGTRRVLGMDAPGAYATHVVWPAERLFELKGLSYEAGAFAEPLAVALHAASIARHAAPSAQSAFIAGSGTIGLLLATALKEAGVEHLIISDLSDARLEVAKAIGATHTVNPSRENTLKRVQEITDGQGTPLSLEAVGLSATVAQSLEVLEDGGTAIWVGNNHRTVEVDMQAVVTRELKVLGSYGMNDEDFKAALELLLTGRVPTDALVSRRVRLADSVGLFEELLNAPETIKCIIEPR